jgi:SAM-dependent methyltransferase
MRFSRQWRESVRYFGFWRALRELAAAFWRAMIELLPSRRKARFGDLDYDWEHEVDTTRSNVGFGTQFLTGITGRPYFATEPWLFEQMMKALALSIQQSALSQGTGTPVGLQDLTFIDLGSGKGRALLMAAPYGFKRIVGVEFMPEWHRVAQENIRRFTAANPSAPPIESLCMEALDFDFPADPLVVYLFNPFPEPLFAAVLERLRKSLLKNLRPVIVAYRYLEFESLLEKCDWLERIARTEQWAIYQHMPFRASKQ